MELQEAIDWATHNLAGSFQYEYYTDQTKAEYAAKAMTTLTNVTWNVLSKADTFWLSQDKVSTSAALELTKTE